MCFSAQAGEESSPSVPFPEAVADPWLTSSNASALTRYSLPNTAGAELWLTKGKGGFTDFSGSPDMLSVGASVESFFRLNSHAVGYGAMSYTNFSGHDMAGSAFIHSTPHLSPLTSHLPFDIVEDSLTNTGTKHQDTYRLTGGFGYSLAGGFALGARLDYTAANLAKYKDLRHQNKLMDLDLTAGFYIPLGYMASDGSAIGAIGANYLYHRTTESLQFSTYGKNDKVYNSLIAYANFMGHVEQFGNTGFTDKSREMPLVSDYNGLSLQFSLSPAAAWSDASCPAFYNSFTYAHRRGYYGRPSPYTITYTGHESDIFRYDARLTARSQCGARFSLDLSLSAENLRNEAANYRELQNEQGATYYEYYTPIKTANKLWTDGTLALTADFGNIVLKGTAPARPQERPALLPSGDAAPYIPTWTLRAGLNWHHREQTAYLYPFYRRQDIRSREPFVSLLRNIVSSRRRAAYWTAALHFSFLKGSGQPFEDLTLQVPSDKQEQPPSMDAYLWREYLWLTAAQYCIGGSVKYSFVFPGTKLPTFVSLSATHRKANETNDYSNGRDHTAATLSVGCRF